MNFGADGMSGLDAEDLLALQESARAQMVDTCAVERKTVSSDGLGGVTESWFTHLTTVYRLVKNRRWREAVSGARQQSVTVWEAEFPVRTDVQPQDRVRPNGLFRVSLARATGGTFTLTFNGETTAPLAYNATAQQVEDALLELSTIGAGEVEVSGSQGGPYTVWLLGALLGSVLQVTGQSALTGIPAGAAFSVERTLFEVTGTNRGVTSAAKLTADLVEIGRNG